MPSSGFSSTTMPAPRPAMKNVSPSSYCSQLSIFSERSAGLLEGSENPAKSNARWKLFRLPYVFRNACSMD